MAETFLEEMKRYIGFTAEDAATLASLAPLIEPHLPQLADRFYEQIPRHSEAAAVFTGGEAQIARLKLTLQHWARGLFSGVYDAAYAQERSRIGYRHVQIALPQRYVISAMHVVARFLRELLDCEVRDLEQRRRALGSLDRIVILDLGLICETYFEGSVRELRHLNERLTLANRSLETANRVKADFLATTSHELRTPLTSVIGFSRLLVDGYVSDPAERHDLLVDVHRNALHLLSLVDDVLDLSRIEAGRLDIKLETVDLVDLIAEVVAVTKVQADAKQLALVVHLPPDVPTVRADRSRTRQVLLNVIGNAIKFTECGEIRIAGATEDDGTRVRIDVTDTGVGIAPDKQPLLFEKFQQLDASHTRKHGGTGLGLAISKALVERMGGRIQVRSEGEGLGTTVTVALPVADRALASVAPVEPTSRKSARPSVVLMGRDSKGRELTAMALRSNGYMVREGATTDGVKALARVEPPDLLVVDLTSGGSAAVRECLDLLVALHADPRTRPIRPVLLGDAATADAATNIQLELLPGRPTIIDKPLDPADLRNALQRVGSAPRSVPFRVLVGDDDLLVFKFVTSVLPPHEYVVLHAPSGREVLRAVETQAFDAVLLDLRMGDESGYDVIRALKLEGRAPELPILVITNYPAPADEEERMLLSSALIVDVLPKPTVAAQPGLLLKRLEAIRSEL